MKESITEWPTGQFFDDHIDECIEKHDAGYSKLNEKAKKMDGMIQEGARNLLNLLADFEGCNYMQVGTWKGACLYSALYKNNVNYAFACDNFSQFALRQGPVFEDDEGGMKTQTNLNSDVMLDLMRPEEEEESMEFEFYDGDSFGIPLDLIKNPINMYFYDGDHNLGSHFMALYYYYPILADSFIFICDDWPEDQVRAGTWSGMESCNCGPRREVVRENMFIAHIVKDKLWNQRRIARKSFELCKLNNQGIVKEPIYR
mgnify:CR=1 FL=1